MIPLSTPVRFPRDSSPPPPRKPLSLFQKLIEVFMLTYTLTRAEALARVRLEYPNLAKENSMNVIINDEEIEIPQENSIGEHLHTIAKALVREGVAKDYSDGLHLARERHPALAEVYDLGQVIEGPRVEYRPPEGEQLLRDLKVRYGKGGGDRSGIVSASTLFEFQNELFLVVKSEAIRAGHDPRVEWEQLLKNDADLRRAVGRSRS